MYDDTAYLLGLGYGIGSLDSKKDAYDKVNAIKVPTLLQIVNNGNYGRTFLVTYDNVKTPGLDGYEVFITLTPDPIIGMFSRRPTGTPVSEEQANYILKYMSPSLFKNALGEDLKPWYKKVLDAIF